MHWVFTIQYLQTSFIFPELLVDAQEDLELEMGEEDVSVNGQSLKIYQQYIAAVGRRKAKLFRIKRTIFIVNCVVIVLMTVPLLAFTIATRNSAWNSSSDVIMTAFSFMQVVISMVLAYALYRITSTVSSLEKVSLNKCFICVHIIGVVISGLSGLVLAYF